MRGVAAAAAVACLALLAGCGKKGPPLPPLEPLFPEFSRVELMQRGKDVRLVWEVIVPPQEGKPVEVVGFEVLSAGMAAGDVPEEPVPGELRDRLKQIADLPVAAGEATLTSHDYLHRGAGVPGAAVLYQLRARTNWKARAVESAIFLVNPQKPPPAAGDLAIELREEGILARWDPAEEAGPFRLYRDDPWTPLRKATLSGAEHLDDTVRLGASYGYWVASTRDASDLETPALRRLELPEERKRTGSWAAIPLTVESAASGPAEALYHDVFPPPVPLGLRAIREASGAVLMWNPVEVPDLRGYNLYRRAEADRDWTLVNREVLLETVYRDRAPVPGVPYRYAVTALDLREPANESERSEEASIQLPGRTPVPPPEARP